VFDELRGKYKGFSQLKLGQPHGTQIADRKHQQGYSAAKPKRLLTIIQGGGVKPLRFAQKNPSVDCVSATRPKASSLRA
jgi:hypothetical protein